MKTKIFNRLFAFLAIALLTAPVYAQDTLPAPPLPPENFTLNKDYNLNKTFDKVELKQKMNKLNLKMADMQKQMFAMNQKLNKQMRLKMTDFDTKLNKHFKDFGKDFSGSFNGMVPDIDNSIKGFDGKLTDEEYKKQVASGEIIERIKSYSKTYSVDGNDELQISNSFGNVVVNTWNKNEFKVDVQMKFSSSDASIVDDMYEGTTISDSKNGSVISFKTNNTWSNNRKGGDNDMSINYTIYKPAGNPLNISNKFGSVTLPDMSGRATIRLQFGNLIAKELTHSQNDISIKFTQDKTATIGLFNGGKLKIEFGKLRAGVLNNVDADFGFTNVNVEKVKGTVDLNIKYKTLNVGSIDRSAKNVNINSSFAKLNFDFKEGECFDFDVTSKMASFDNSSSRAKITSRTPSEEERGYSSTKNYKGYIGKSNSDNKITITANFGNINFN
jgi:hypothetical protein